MAATNFLQWNPGQANQETDPSYVADPSRTGGAATGAIFASPLANKLFYQLTTFVAAFSNMLVAKGYSPNDANIATLAALLANVITAADLAALNYLPTATWLAAQPFSTAIGGTGATSLNAAKIANRVGQYDIIGHTGAITAQTLMASTPSGRYTVKWNAHMASGSIGTALTVTVTWTQGGISHTVNVFPPCASTDGQTDSGEVNIFPDNATAVTCAQTQVTGQPYDLHVWLEAN
jgi:hypothetical protein